MGGAKREFTAKEKLWIGMGMTFGFMLVEAIGGFYARSLAMLGDAAQTGDQAGFRSGYSCEDHLFPIVMLVEKAYEHQITLWAATVDYQKAFDTVEHDSVWQAMRRIGVPIAYVRFLAWLYRQQIGTIVGEVTSNAFAIRRGTKHGDPLSPNIFNTVLEALRETFRRNGARKAGALI